jgi:hypothetical protein
MTSQPHHPATDRPPISEDEADGAAAASDSPLAAGDQDLVVMPEETVPRSEDAAGASSTEDDETADDRMTGASQASDVSDDYPPASEPGVVAAEDAASGGPLAADVRPTDLGEQWHDIQAMFVDDPRGSVQRAAAAADAAVSALAELLRERQAALSPAGGACADTEQLRETLRSYRIFCQSLADVGNLM